jgi:hypothetical protein
MLEKKTNKNYVRFYFNKEELLLQCMKINTLVSIFIDKQAPKQGVDLFA